MAHEGHCKYCPSTWVSWHHISHKPRSFPKKFSYLDYSLNLVEVCILCHDDIHRHSGTGNDMELKEQLQNKLEELFFKEYYTSNAIQKLLKFKDIQTRGFCKGMMLHPEGYGREDIIRRLMNNQLAREIKEVA